MSSFTVIRSDQLTVDDIDPNLNNPNKKVEGPSHEEKVEDVNSLFMTPTPDDYAIALIDTSASTTYKFYPGNVEARQFEESVFGTQCEILKQLPHKKFFLLFWCSKQLDGLYKQGFRTIPGAVAKESMELLFSTEYKKIIKKFTTNTALAFQNLPVEWLKTTKTVYLVTDGDMGGGELDQATVKRELAAALKKFGGNLSILTVERAARDYNNSAEVNNAAGTDVYKTIQENKLTNFISKFVSHYPGQEPMSINSFTHIQKMTPPTGYIPYGDKYFLELNMDKFVQFVSSEIIAHNSESEQLAIAQKLSNTLFHLLKNKSKTMVQSNIRSFSRLFTLDQQVIYYILGDSILQESEGRAQVLSDYRRNLQNLFKDAQKKLGENVAQAIGMEDSFVSYPVFDKEYSGRALHDEKETVGRTSILTGPAKLVTDTFTSNAGKFPRGCVATTPVFGTTYLSRKLSLFNDQCLRQWTRTVYSNRFGLNIQDDLIIYLVLTEALVVYRSPVDITVKNSYLALARTILNKKRTTVEMTEAKYLLEGNAPTIHNGTVQDFIQLLETTLQTLKISGKPMKLWYEIIQMLEIVFPGMLNAQKMHCENHPDFASELVLPVYEVDSVSSSSAYDYNCYITLMDISRVGGYGFSAHKSPTGFDCSPIFMVSNEGMEQLNERRDFTCPVCYAKLSCFDYVRLPPQIESKVPAVYSNNVRSNARYPSAADQKNLADAVARLSVNDGHDRHLIFMRGVVGAGKTTLSNYIQQKYDALGYKVFNEGTDKYCKSGVPMKSAIGRVKQQLQKAANTSGKCITIVDTCGEFKDPNPFGVNFNGWKISEVYPNLDRNNLMGYLAWTLTNVLSRGPSDQNTEFYLNPTAGIQICRDVHRKKAIALGLYDRNFEKLSDSDRMTLASQYAQTIKPVEFELDH